MHMIYVVFYQDSSWPHDVLILYSTVNIGLSCIASFAAF